MSCSRAEVQVASSRRFRTMDRTKAWTIGHPWATLSIPQAPHITKRLRTNPSTTPEPAPNAHLTSANLLIASWPIHSQARKASITRPNCWPKVATVYALVARDKPLWIAACLARRQPSDSERQAQTPVATNERIRWTVINELLSSANGPPDGIETNKLVHTLQDQKVNDWDITKKDKRLMT